ncbi:hypothetical protein BCR43DRAFT_508801 [Syncephalastrum racemosum]|uniref:Homeobox domain-containing protein n=1 Tax=Syncephalastrum racemosum TaxID=13706 RepID=A0A1X2H1U1_SYNRA|nr:hypothetical protein BCR43DRAFT_508801 [Syncephalastrum racemosum]
MAYCELEAEIAPDFRLLLLDASFMNLPTEQPSNAPSAEETDDSSSSSGSNIRRRQRFSQEQVAVLDAAFRANPYPSRQRRCQLAQQFCTPVKRIWTWFDNKRQAVRRGSMASGRSTPGPGAGVVAPPVPFPYSISEHLTTGDRDRQQEDSPAGESSSGSSHSSPGERDGPIAESSAPRQPEPVYLMRPRRLAKKIKGGFHCRQHKNDDDGGLS